MGKLPLKFETEALNRATMVRGVHDLDCVVCPCLKVTGGKHGIVVHCNHPALCMPVHLNTQFGSKPPKWCPRLKAMLAAMKVKQCK